MLPARAAKPSGLKLRPLSQLRRLRGRRVLVRVDFSVPLHDGVVAPTADDRIRRSLPTVRYLKRHGAIVVLATHLGRPHGQRVAGLSVRAVARYLTQRCGLAVLPIGTVQQAASVAAVRRAVAGTVLLLENLRFDPGEERNDPTFAAALARLADGYVNEAFSNSHRAHASMVGTPKLLPSYAGLLLAEEVTRLSALRTAPRRPFCAIIGGAKLSTKLAVLAGLLKIADHVLLGGKVANTVLAASGVAVGSSPVEAELVAHLRQLDFTATQLRLPQDVVTTADPGCGTAAKTKAVGNVAADESILDIGPQTVRLFATIIHAAATVVWNGPMGMFERPAYAAGTVGVIVALAHSRARIVVGGGETLDALRQYLPKPPQRYPNLYLSTGGGAMLKFLEQGTLPALEPLRLP